MLYFFNENIRPKDSMGAMSYHQSMDDMLFELEPFMVGVEHFAFTSAGQRIHLAADSECGPIRWRIDEVPQYEDVARNLIYEMLVLFSSYPNSELCLDGVDSSASLEKLVSLVPMD